MTIHIPVLSQEVSEYLTITPTDIVLDATLGGGGHSSAIAAQLGKDGMLIALDADSRAIEQAQGNETLKRASCQLHFIQSNFRNIDTALEKLGIITIDKALFDLGWSMDQFADSERGFSFDRPGPLDMRLDTSDPESLTAGEIVNEWEEESIIDILQGYGEERYARRIAQAIIIARSDTPITSTEELVHIIEGAVPAPYRRGRIHPATRTFQALRIAVNDELGALKEGIAKAFDYITPGGVMAVISFHSLEDRVVKRFFQGKEAEALGKVITKKPVIPTDEEVAQNRRARSAKLRVIKKL